MFYFTTGMFKWKRATGNYRIKATSCPATGYCG